MKYRTQKLENGNVALIYKMRNPMEKPWIIICIGILFGCILLIEYLLNSTTISLFPLIIIFFFIFLFWIVYPLKENEKIEQEWLNKNVDTRLHNELCKYKEKVMEVRRKYYQETVGTYGVVVATYLLVLLSNGEILEYELKNHSITEKGEAYKELIRHPSICTDKSRIKAIKKKSLYEWWKKNVNATKAKSFLWMCLFFLLYIGFTAFVVWLFIINGKEIIYYILGYIVLIVVNQEIISSTTNTFLKRLKLIIRIPSLIFYVWLTITFPIIIVCGSFLCTGLFAFGIPALFMVLIELLFGFDFVPATIIFVSLSIGSITCVFFSNIVQWFIKERSPLKNWGNHKYEKIKEELGLYVVKSSNINFLIYLTYFVFLAISGFMHFQSGSSLINPDIDESVLKAFIVFIAYSNVVKHFKNVDFDKKTFFEKVIKLIFTHDEK